MFARIVFVAAILAPVPALAEPAQQFLNYAIDGDHSEVTLGRLTSERGASPQVRDFGSMLVTDHTKAQQQAMQVANREGIHPQVKLAPEASAEMKKLQGMHGAAFDREIKRYMIDDHQKDIAKFEAQARTGDPQTRQLAEQTLPVLRKHLAAAKALPG